jgi:hypothetical protein
MYGANEAFQALERNKTHGVLHRQTLASRNISVELQNVFQAVIRIVNYVKNSQLRGRLCEVMLRYGGRTYDAPVLLCHILALSRQGASRSFEVK